MKKYTCLACCIAFIFPFNGFSQLLAPTVISSSGGFYSNTSGMLSFTTGELAATETYTKPNSILTQGFQQPWDFGTYIVEHPVANFSYGFYPNPTDGYFFVLTDSELDLQVSLAILDIVGREIFRHDYHQESKINVHPVDITFAPEGTYILSLRIHDGSSDAEDLFVHKITLVK
jgi:hypothetical protein